VFFAVDFESQLRRGATAVVLHNSDPESQVHP